jgi:hypothetical protein
MLLLAFTLSIVALVCFIIVVSVNRFNTKVIMEPNRIRGFKNNKLWTSAVLVPKRARWVNSKLSKIRSQVGVDAQFEVSEGLAKIYITSNYAGRFSSLSLQFEVRDILNIFSKRIQAIYADLTYDSLPLSILRPLPRSRPLPLALGERSGKSPGSSLELYSIEQYQPFTETKNILWKKVARMPDESLVVRIRDSSIPKVIRIGFIQISKRDPRAKLELIDRTCEAIGMMGNSLLATGSTVEIYHASKRDEESKLQQDSISIHEISSLEGLADALMELSESSPLNIDSSNTFKILDQSDILVCGARELEQRSLALPISKLLALVIAERDATPLLIGQRAMMYTGVEDVRKLVSKVLEK